MTEHVEASVQPKLKLWIRFVSKCLLLLLVVLLPVGITYEQIGERQDRKRFPQVGRSVDIGGRSLNIFCSGEGGPAAILDTRAGAPCFWHLPFSSPGAHGPPGGQFSLGCVWR